MKLLSFLKDKFLPLLSDNDRIYNLTGSSAALLLALEERPFVAIEKDAISAEILAKDINFYRALISGIPVIYMSDAEGAEGSGERAEMMLRLQPNDSIITSFENLSASFWDRDFLKEQMITLKKGCLLERASFEEALVGIGYKSRPMVLEKGDYSRRGWIVDVFPTTSESPVRVEFFGDEIEQIRTFEIDSQKSTGDIEEIVILPAEKPELSWGFRDIAGDRKFYCMFSPEQKELLPDGCVFLSRYSFEFGSLPEETEKDLKQADAGLLSVRGLGFLPEERKSLEDIPMTITNLSKLNRVVIVLPSAGQIERLKNLFAEKDQLLPEIDISEMLSYKGMLSISEGRLSNGLYMGGLLVLTERDIFGDRRVFRQQKKSKVANLLASLDDIVPGDFVVHREHGVGKFSGIIRRHDGSTELELMQIEYQDGRLYIPIQNIQSLSKYRSEEGYVPHLDKLGGKTWERKKERARKKIGEIAEKLVALYASRKVVRGFTFSQNSELHREFAGFFPYDETPDQTKAIAEIERDMESEKPMDRLLCGDVGYGKTEVAMRAAFKAVYDNKQVAMLVPTTILAEQHYSTFKERFSGFPVRIDHVSRFRSRKEINEIMKSITSGDTDIVIGTHALLSKKLQFRSLGLLIVDEEHKFGVSQKERIKELSKNVDVLNMTATPIPRTLHMALSGIREISVIETPPEDRLAVKTIVTVFDDKLLKDAISRELDRNGQVFFVHNRISDLYRIAEKIKMLVPEARLVVAHGQMPEKDLEDAMHRFFNTEVDILLSTAIIGSGLDIPKANTIIVDRADKMGLADLYQLRGRVGRGSQRGYAFFIIPGESLMSDEAKKRIQAIQEMSYLGAGFRLAMRDLEIRGAGNIFGAEQSGHIHEIGFDLYIEMLEDAVAKLKGEEIRQEIEPVIELDITALIPDEYIEDVMVRMSFYRRISTLRSDDEMKDLATELRDRFGEVPEETENLLAVMGLKIVAKALSVQKIKKGRDTVRIVFDEGTCVQPQQMFELQTTHKGRIKYHTDGFEIHFREYDGKTVLADLRDVLDLLHGSQGGI